MMASISSKPKDLDILGTGSHIGVSPPVNEHRSCNRKCASVMLGGRCLGMRWLDITKPAVPLSPSGLINNSIISSSTDLSSAYIISVNFNHHSMGILYFCCSQQTLTIIFVYCPFEDDRKHLS